MSLQQVQNQIDKVFEKNKALKIEGTYSEARVESLRNEIIKLKEEVIDLQKVKRNLEKAIAESQALALEQIALDRDVARTERAEAKKAKNEAEMELAQVKATQGKLDSALDKVNTERATLQEKAKKLKAVIREIDQ